MGKFESKKLLPIITVDWEDFKQVKLWSKNPRRNQKAVKDLALVLARYGQRTPLSVWEKDGVIYKGNTTYKALSYLAGLSKEAFKKFTKSIKDPYRPKKVFVAWMRFESQAEAELYGTADNKAGEWAEWDYAALADLTQEHLGDISKEKAFAMSGLREVELNDLLNSSSELPDELPKVDIIGTADTLKADYCIIEMPSKKVRLQFMEAIGVDHFRNRVVKLEKLNEFLDKEFITEMENINVGKVTNTPQKKGLNKKVPVSKESTTHKPKKKFKFKLRKK